ncbi:MAG: hypothetical protein QW701_01370 [Candidatus Nezhaarchaeales archaeon]
MELNVDWLTTWEGFWFYIFIIFLILFYGGVRKSKKTSESATKSG